LFFTPKGAEEHKQGVSFSHGRPIRSSIYMVTKLWIYEERWNELGS